MDNTTRELVLPHIPNELLIHILSFCEPYFLWTTARKVSRAFAEWSEERYLHHHLRNRKIYAYTHRLSLGLRAWYKVRYTFVFSKVDELMPSRAIFEASGKNKHELPSDFDFSDHPKRFSTFGIPWLTKSPQGCFGTTYCATGCALCPKSIGAAGSIQFNTEDQTLEVRWKDVLDALFTSAGELLHAESADQEQNGAERSTVPDYFVAAYV